MSQPDKALVPRPPFGASVQRGMPRSFWRDVYFQLMHHSWPRVLTGFIALYILINTTFALAYWIVPGSIANARPDEFFDYFFFSVQTLATIGYGVMSPQTPYAHLVVTVEAAVGLIGVAMTTGVMFAKLSRPKAQVLFSKPLLVIVKNGLQTLSFRVANARGNDIVEATVRVVMLVSEVSPEGHRMRRMVDVPLVRDNSPFFRLSWTIMHVLDEQSPITKSDLLSPGGSHVAAVLVTMNGHDGTYGQTIYARHTYFPGDIVKNHRFVDVLSELPDGRTLIDYTKFHLIEPESE